MLCLICHEGFNNIFIYFKKREKTITESLRGVLSKTLGMYLELGNICRILTETLFRAKYLLSIHARSKRKLSTTLNNPIGL